MRLLLRYAWLSYAHIRLSMLRSANLRKPCKITPKSNFAKLLTFNF